MCTLEMSNQNVFDEGTKFHYESLSVPFWPFSYKLSSLGTVVKLNGVIPGPRGILTVITYCVVESYHPQHV